MIPHDFRAQNLTAHNLYRFLGEERKGLGAGCGGYSLSRGEAQVFHGVHARRLSEVEVNGWVEMPSQAMVGFQGRQLFGNLQRPRYVL